MSNMKRFQILGAIALGAAFAIPVQAGQAPTPSSVNESAPKGTNRPSTGAGGTAVIPGKGPSSVSESAPDKTGKEGPAALQNDSKNMPNPKTPMNVNESGQNKPQKGKSSTKRSTKSTDSMYK